MSLQLRTNNLLQGHLIFARLIIFSCLREGVTDDGDEDTTEYKALHDAVEDEECDAEQLHGAGEPMDVEVTKQNHLGNEDREMLYICIIYTSTYYEVIMSTVYYVINDNFRVVYRIDSQ